MSIRETIRKPLYENWILTSLYFVVVLTYLCVVGVSDLRNIRSSDIDPSNGKAFVIYVFAFWTIVPGSILIFDTMRHKVYKVGIALCFGAMGDLMNFIQGYDALTKANSALIFFGSIALFAIQNSIFLYYYYAHIVKHIWWVYAIYCTVYLLAFAILFAVFKMYNDAILCALATIYGVILCLASAWGVLTENKLSGIGFIFHLVFDLTLIFRMYTKESEAVGVVIDAFYMILYWVGIYCMANGAIQLTQTQQKSATDESKQQSETQLFVKGRDDINNESVDDF